MLDDNDKLEINNAKKKYEKFLQKVNAQIIEKIDNDVENIYTFDTENPDLTNFNTFFHINELEEEEKKFSDNFKDYNDLMNNEGKNIKINREKNFKSNTNFSNRIGQNELLSKLISEHNPSHTELLSQNLDKVNIYEKLPELNENIENEIFNDLLNEFNSPIGNIESTTTFIYKYSVHDNYHLMVNAYKAFNYWRPSICDGNSFYRTFMFALLEQYITSGKIVELKKIINDIIQEDYITFYRDKGIDVEIPLLILTKILNLVENHKLLDAYQIFYKAYFLKNHSFDYLLIFYLRYVVYYYANQVNKALKNYSEQNEERLDKDDLFNIEAIKEFGIEPEFILICYLPYLYDISFKIFWVDNNGKDGSINFVEEDSDNLPSLSLGMFYSNFTNLYPEKVNENLRIIINRNIPYIKQLTYCDNKKYNCDICNKDTVHYIFLEKKFYVCKPCLRNYIDKIMTDRYTNFESEYFNGLEYYNKPIHLQDDYYIDNYDIIEIYFKNMINLLKNKNSICCSCADHISSKKYTLECDCNYCEKCFTQLLKDATQNHMFLNIYEINHFKKIQCKCGKDINVNYASNLSKNNKKYISNAENRLEEYCKTLCLKCLKQLKKKKENKNDYEVISKFYDVSIEKEKNVNKIECYDGNHIICPECNKNEKNVKLENEENEENDNKPKILCNICNKNHIKNKEIGGQCCGKCNIF